MISPDSDLYQRPSRTGACMCRTVKTSPAPPAVRQLDIDVSRKDVRDNIYGQMYKILSSAKIRSSTSKWDINRQL